MPETRTMVRPMQIFSFLYGTFWTVVGIGILFLADRGDNKLFFAVLVTFLLLLGVGTIYGSLRLKLEVTGGELKYHGFLSSYEVPLSEVTHVTIEPYKGGIFFPLHAPASWRIIHVHGDFEPKALDGVVGKEPHVRQVCDYLTAQLSAK